MLHELNEVIKRMALQAVDASAPVSVCYGDVVSEAPLKVRIDQKLTLDENYLDLTGFVKDMEIELEDETGGTKTYTVKNRLKKDENVILLRRQGGQRYIVLDRLR